MADTDLSPVIIKLDPADRDAYRAADLAWRQAKVRSIDAERQRASLEAAKASALTIGAAAKTRDDEAALAATADEDKLVVEVAAISKAGYGDIKHHFTDIGYEPTTGNLVCKREPLLQGTTLAAVKTLKMTDAQAAAFVASYLRGIEASHLANDLARQVAEYEAAHPAAKDAGLIGGPAFSDPDYDKLVADRDAQQKAARDEQAAQGAIFAAVVPAADLAQFGTLYGGSRMNTNGTIELTEMPPAPKAPEKPVEGGGGAEVIP